MLFYENWYEEKCSAYLYEVLAKKETNPAYKQLFHNLSAMANKQAAIWEKKLKEEGEPLKPFRPSFRTLLIAKLITYFGPQRLKFILSAMKIRGMSVYLNADPNYPFPSPPAHHEHKHKYLTTAGNIRAAIFGVNDGLISNISLVLGIAGATSNQNLIILSGIAGLFAGAFSMAAGEYISVRSQREFFEYQIHLERQELALYPEEEAAELALIYEARGIPKVDAAQLSKLIISNPEKALDTLAREELGLNPAELGSPWGAAISSFISFAFGAAIPLIPFLWGTYKWNLSIAILLTALTLFSIGATLSLFTNKSALLSGLRMLGIGAGAGAITYLVGHLVGVSLY